MSDEHAWVREQLSALGRPSIPADVADRMTTAIATESAATAAAADSGPASGTGTALPTVPAQASAANRRSAPRRRNRTLVALTGVAASFILFAAVGPMGTTTEDPADGVGIAAAPEDAPAMDGDTTAESPTQGVPGSPGGAAAADLDRVSRVMTATDTPYSRNTMAAQVGNVAAGPAAAAPERGSTTGSAPDTRAPGADGASSGSETADAASGDVATADPDSVWATIDSLPAASLAGAGACVTGLPEGVTDLVFVDRARFEGQPALVSARYTAQGELEVIVQAATCTADDPAVLYRTTIVP